MRIRAAGSSVTVGELRALMTEADTRDDAEVMFADFGMVVAAEAGPFSLELEAENEPIDQEELLEEILDFLELVAAGEPKGAKALKVIREMAAELVAKSGRS